MAEGEKTSQDGGWWSSWITTAKEKTEKAFEMVSQDLTEFTTTMQSDTKKVVEKTKETLQTNEDVEKTGTDRMKQSFYSLMEGITKALTVEPEDTSPPRSSASQPASGIFDRAKARLRAVQVDTGTYLSEPSGVPELYADWLKSFDIEVHKGEISDLLVSMVEVRSLYTSLVPSEVSHQDFWRRYFYKVHQLEVDEARKKALMKRAERANVKEDSISWDEEGWGSGDEESSPGQPAGESREDPASRLKPAEPVSDGVAESGAVTEGPSSVQIDRASETVAATNQLPSTDKKITARIKDIETETSNTVDQGQKETDQVHEAKEPINIEVIQASNDCDNEKGSQGSIGDEVPVDVKEENNKTKEETKPVENIPSGKENVTKLENNDKSESNTSSKPEEVKCDIGSKTGPETDIAARKEAQSGQEPQSDGLAGSDLKTSVKGDMVVVGDRISPSSECSENKESSTEDWEHDFDDVNVTAEDLQAAHELANKLNMSPAEYSTITGEEEEDWENWD